MSQRGELVLHPRGNLGVGGAREQAVAFEGFEGHGKHPLRDARNARLQVGATVLGRDELLGLDVTTVIPELTMVPHTPALAELLPKHKASMAAAHDKARQLATAIAAA